MKEIKLVLIDDDKGDLQKYANIFQLGLKDEYNISVKQITVEEINNNTSILDSLDSDALLVDQELFRIESGNNILVINGVTLSMHLRQKYPNIPIFIFTNNKIPNIKESNYFDSEEYIDEFLIKGDYADIKLIKESEFLKIVEGYQNLREHEIKSFDDIISALSLPERNFEYIRDDVLETIPQKFLNSKISILHYYKIAKWIRKTLMNYPGLLYDDIHAATFFGISVNSFREKSIQEFFKSAKYKGLFSNDKEMWWKSELIECSDDFLDIDERQMPYSQGFQKGWEKKTGDKLDPAVCVYSNKTPADWICCVLNEPVMIKYTLRYLKDNRPSVMDEARICFKAIYDDKYNLEQIEAESREIFDDLFSRVGEN